jgi:hypothetical protein
VAKIDEGGVGEVWPAGDEEPMVSTEDDLLSGIAFG